MQDLARNAALVLAAVLVWGGASVRVAAAGVALLPVASGLNQPVFLTAPSGDASRLFVLEKTGAVRVIQDGVLLATPYVTVPVNTSGERGLLGMAFAPDFATSGAFYLDYIDSTTLNTTVVRFTVPNPSANVATGASATTVFTAQQEPFDNHKGGWIGFRPGENSNLYIATGDGGSANNPNNTAQNLSNPLGKIHRIDVSGSGAGGVGVPAAGNPFLGGATTADDTVWAYGLRNPFRDSFDRANGNFYIADVGQDTREEVDVENAGTAGGRNYGWRALEGSGDNPAVSDPAPAGAVGPVFDYAHSDQTFAGTSASITGGYVYRGSLAPELYGQYLFGDYVSGKLGALTYDPATGAVVPGSVANIDSILDPGNLIGPGQLSSFGEDANGELYLVTIDGRVFEVVPEPSAIGGFVVTGALLRRVRLGVGPCADERRGRRGRGSSRAR